MILFLDCYDSFSYNLTHLIESACQARVQIAHHDQLSAAQLSELLPRLHAIVIGPGPGDPHNSKDRGVLDELFDLLKSSPVPLFGVCFGHQSLVLNFNGQVSRMSPPKHGRISQIRFSHSEIFAGVPQDFEVVRYHSLCTHSAKSILRVTAHAEDDGIEMAVEHPDLPFYGVQFHPESVRSTYGAELFKNFWRVACEFNANRNVSKQPIPKQMTVTYDSLMKKPPSSHQRDLCVVECGSKIDTNFESEFVCLKSAAFPGKWTIYGMLDESVIHIRSKNGIVYEGLLHQQAYTTYKGNVWEHMAEFMTDKLLTDEESKKINVYNVPFLGGLVGYVTYEGACTHTVNNGQIDESGMHSDFSFVYVTKSVVIDESSGKSYAVGPLDFVEQVIKGGRHQPVKPAVDALPKISNLSSIDFESYYPLIEKCFEKLLSGDSYELCLTTQANIEFEEIDPWRLYQCIVERNPAPYCSFMNFDDTLIATSPERYMYWDRNHCEFRPIKGTVKKSESMTHKLASDILKTDKEQAENLMIVDLIRHDIGHLLESVTTPQLMVVEEYHSVFQLVTSVEGKFSPQSNVCGFDVLSQSLPPGSMTGAPKQRSCEILKQIENSPRGMYSGVQGYWSIDDRGDFSVIIRSLFKRRGSKTYSLGAGGGITVLSTAQGEYEEMQAKMDSVLQTFE